jgi:hypothetical protein
MSYIDNFIKEIQNSHRPEDIEFELKLVFNKQYKNGRVIKVSYDKDQIKKIYRELFSKLKEQYEFKECQLLNIVSKDGMNKRFEYKDGSKIEESKTLYIKDRIREYYIQNKELSWKVKACRESDRNNFDDSRISYDYFRFKRRFSTFLNDEWRLDFTFIIEVPYNTKLNIMCELRDKLFMTELHRIFNPELNIDTEIEIEYMKSLCHLSYGSISKVLSLFPTVDARICPEYQSQAINQLKDMLTYKYDPKFRNKDITIKSLLPQTAMLTKREYFNIILENKSNQYYVSHKLDGERVILFIDNHNSGYLTTNKWNNLQLKKPIDYIIILDCELHNNVFYVFDILKYVTNILGNPFVYSLFKCPYLIRKRCINNLQNVIHDIELNNDMIIRIKPSYKFGPDHINTLNLLEDQKVNYPCDGIIFTSIGESYLDTKYYKWKQPNDMTIDFIAKKCPKEIMGIPPHSKINGKTLYLLYSGIRQDMANAFAFKKPKYYYNLFKLNRFDYIPIQFTPSNDPLAYLYYSDLNNLDDKVVEMVWNNEWKFVRLRPDRQIDYKNNKLFGNNFRIAEETWNTYKNPFLYDQLKLSCDEMKKQFYFINNDADQYRGIRKFNNWVKIKIFEAVCKNEQWVIDLCSGKGQDLVKYIHLNIKNVLFIDNNINNIDEIISRKYLYYNQKHFKDTSMSINTICKSAIDITLPDDIAKFTKDCKFIVCNFGIHYLCYNLQSINNFVANITKTLQKGGRFMCTYLNGEKIFNLLVDKDEWTSGKYHIKKQYMANKFTGTNQKIKIKLPFSNDFCDEYLFDINLLIKAFKAKKITLENKGQFSEYIDKYQHSSDINNRLNQFGLQNDDLEYIPLVEYALFYYK